MTRENNTGVGPCITERAAIGNRAHSDAAISIHADGGPTGGSGFAILIPAPIADRANQRIIRPSLSLAVALRSSLLRMGLHPSTYDGVDGLAPRSDLGGLNLSRVPKVFVEVANMQNGPDERLWSGPPTARPSRGPCSPASSASLRAAARRPPRSGGEGEEVRTPTRRARRTALRRRAHRQRAGSCAPSSRSVSVHARPARSSHGSCTRACAGALGEVDDDEVPRGARGPAPAERAGGRSRCRASRCTRTAASRRRADPSRDRARAGARRRPRRSPSAGSSGPRPRNTGMRVV